MKKIKLYISTLFILVSLSLVYGCKSGKSLWINNDENQLNVYVCEELFLPRGYLLFDRVDSVFLLTEPFMGGSIQSCILGFWKQSSDSIFATPKIDFNPNSSVERYPFPPLSAINEWENDPSEASTFIDADYKYLIAKDKVLDISDTYPRMPDLRKEPDFLIYNLVYGGLGKKQTFKNNMPKVNKMSTGRYLSTIYAAESRGERKNEYIILDKIEHNAFMIHPKEDICRYIAGIWKLEKDTITITPYMIISPNKAHKTIDYIKLEDVTEIQKFILHGKTLTAVDNDDSQPSLTSPQTKFHLIHGEQPSKPYR